MGVLLPRLSLLPDQTAGDGRCHVSAETVATKAAPSPSVSPVPSAVSTGGDGAQTQPDAKPLDCPRSAGYNSPMLAVGEVLNKPSTSRYSILAIVANPQAIGSNRAAGYLSVTFHRVCVSQGPAAVTERRLRPN